MILLLIIGLVTFFIWWHVHGKRRHLPPGPMPYPFLGNLPQLGDDQEFWGKQFYDWGKQYGGMFTIWFPDATIMVTDYKVMKEAFTGANGDILAGRPSNKVFEEMVGGKYGLIFIEGPRWQQQRRFTSHVLRDFGFGRGLMEDKIHLDIDRLIEHFQQQVKSGNVQLDVDLPVSVCVASTISNLALGVRYGYNDPLFNQFFEYVRRMFICISSPEAVLMASNPWMAKIPYKGHCGMDELKTITKDFTTFFDKQIAEHKIEILKNPDEEATDLCGAYILEMKKRQDKDQDLESFSHWQLVNSLWDLWSAGMETTAVTIRWILLFVATYPEVQEKWRAEIKDVLGDRRCSMGDKLSMPYTQAVIYEAQRHASILPVGLLPRMTTRDTEFGGAKIYKGTPVIMQIDAVLRDPVYFENPKEFNPERFLKSDGTFDTTIGDKVVMFGMGKRACLGESMARMNMTLITVTLIQHYRIKVAAGDRDPMIPEFMFTRQPGKHELIFEAV